jgi:hypothetical protein
MTNINDPWPEDEITTALDDLPEVDPPSTLVQNVMSTIASRGAAPAVHSLVIPTKRGEIMAKKVLWIVAAAAAVALITMRFVGYPPVEKGTEATIGAAQRYQSPQISSADVKTQDPQLQAFLQSDLFRQLTTDKAARQALKNKDFQRALSDPAVRAALVRPDVRDAIAAMSAANNGVKQDAMSARLQALSAKYQALQVALEASPALRVALVSPDVVAAMAASDALRVALAKPDVAMFLSQDAVISALASSDAALGAAEISAGAVGGAAAKDAAPSAVR